MKLNSESSRYQGTSTELIECREKLTLCEELSRQKEDELRELKEKLVVMERIAEDKRLELKKKAEMKIGNTKRQLAAQYAAQTKEYQERIQQIDKAREKALEEKQSSLNEAGELRAQISVLETQATKLRSDAAAQKSMLEAEILNLRHSSERKDQELLQMQEAKQGEEQSLRSEIERLSLSLVAEQEKARSLEENLQQSEESREALERSLSESEAGTQRMTSEMEGLRENLDNTEKEKRDLEEVVAREREESENTVKTLKSKVKVSERATERIESEWKSKMEEIIVQANTERIKMVEEHESTTAALLADGELLQQQLTEAQSSHKQLHEELSHVREEQSREEGEVGRHAREMESRATELEKRLNESLETFDSEKTKLLENLKHSEVEKRTALNRVQELEEQVIQVQKECDGKITNAVRKREGEGRHERDEEVEALRRRVDELTGAAAQIMRLESMVRDQRQTLRTQESEMQNLIEENSQLQV